MCVSPKSLKEILHWDIFLHSWKHLISSEDDLLPSFVYTEIYFLYELDYNYGKL